MATPACLIELQNGGHRCIRFGFVLPPCPGTTSCNCPDGLVVDDTWIAEHREQLLRGPGDFLHEMIRFWTGEDIRPDCQCRLWIARMNAWGPAGCREHCQEIVAHMLAEATKRGWKLATWPGAATACRLAVLRACRQAEREAKKIKPNED